MQRLLSPELSRRMSTIGQKQSEVAGESGRSMFELSGSLPMAQPAVRRPFEGGVRAQPQATNASTPLPAHTDDVHGTRQI